MAQKYFAMLKKELKDNKEGLIGGGVVGAGIAAYLQNEGAQAIMAAGDTGLVDVLAPNLAPLTSATLQFYLVAILIGMAVGYLIDKFTKWI